MANEVSITEMRSYARDNHAGSLPIVPGSAASKWGDHGATIELEPGTRYVLLSALSVDGDFIAKFGDSEVVASKGPGAFAVNAGQEHTRGVPEGATHIAFASGS
jgi:hypothetical protein